MGGKLPLLAVPEKALVEGLVAFERRVGVDCLAVGGGKSQKAELSLAKFVI